MASEVPGLTISLEAAGDLSAKQYHFVKVTAANTAGAATATTDKCIGVLQNKPSAAGRAATVQTSGVTKMIAQAGITAGAVVGTHTDGKAITATGTVQALGIALTSCANQGEVVSVLLLPFGYNALA